MNNTIKLHELKIKELNAHIEELKKKPTNTTTDKISTTNTGVQTENTHKKCSSTNTEAISILDISAADQIDYIGCPKTDDGNVITTRTQDVDKELKNVYKYKAQNDLPTTGAKYEKNTNQILILSDDLADIATIDASSEYFAATHLKTQTTNINEMTGDRMGNKPKSAQLDNKTRSNNIIVFGLQSENIVKSLKDLGDSLESKLDLQDTNNTFFLPNRSRNKILLKVEFITYWKKLEVLKYSHKLKDSNIFIANDLIPEDQVTHKTLRSYLNTVKSNGLKATIRQNQLILNGSKYTPEQLASDPSLVLGVNSASDGNQKRKEPSSPEELNLRERKK
ncbi:hypothetical protein JTB14_025743 [Gonioctena quinquepunctata]|nr:hypothetical protein JTB14_025743 [Gonioctena quinquepunctata]